MSRAVDQTKKYLLTGVSYAIPFVACGGIMIAIAFVPMTPTGPDFSGSPFLKLILDIGIAASGGIARAPAVLLSRRAPGPPPGGWPKETVDDEVARVRAAVRDAQASMRARMDSAPRGVEHDILRAHLSSVMEMEGLEGVETALRDFAASLRGSALVTEDLVRLSSQSASQEEAIRELVDMLHADGRVDDPDAVEDAVWLREETYPTGMGYGVAIPHCKSPGVTVNSIAVLKLDAPVFWKMPNQDPVQFLILIAIAASAKGDEHLKIIAGLARRLVHEEFRQQLMDAAGPGTIVDLLEH